MDRIGCWMSGRESLESTRGVAGLAVRALGYDSVLLVVFTISRPSLSSYSTTFA